MLLFTIVLVSVVALLFQMHFLDNHLSDASFLPLETIKRGDHVTKGDEQLKRARAEKEKNRDIDDDSDDDLKPILQILRQGGYNVSKEHKTVDRSKLPKWSDIVEAYGPPKIIGLENCEEYREKIASDDRNMGPAGMFNTGTNLLAWLIRNNCKYKGKPSSAFQVPWGKHFPAIRRTNHTHHLGRNDKSKIPPYWSTLPIVTVRDPYTWMQSMCRQNYAARFDFAKSQCPNIIPYPSDIEAHKRYGKMKYMPVSVKYDTDYVIRYESLVHLWNEWYGGYIKFEDKRGKEKQLGKNNATTATMKPPGFPFLLVRMEDLVFHAQTVVPQLCKCAGTDLVNDKVIHHAEILNANSGIDTTGGMDQGLLRSVIKYGNVTNRRKGYPRFQLEAAKDLLDPRLMDVLAYRYEEP